MDFRRRGMGLIAVSLVLASASTSRAQAPATESVAEILNRNDRTLVRELSEYLIRSPKAEDRDQAYAALFNKAIEHDWFVENQESAERYLKEQPEGPVRSLAQVIAVMAKAKAKQFPEALSRYKELMQGLTMAEQEEFAASFSETFAASAVAAGEIETAAQVYQTLAAKFPDSAALKLKVETELGRLARVGKPAPAVEAQDVEGKTVRLADLRGKYVLVDFWATWCMPNLAELPRLQEAYKKYHGSGFEIVSVSLDDTRTAVADFVKTRKLPWIQLHNATAGADLVEAFGVSSIPATYLIDPQGTIIRLDLRGGALDEALSRTLRPAG
ncbi:TlpA family protein disulfide reductase [Paludisphaera rhizosphaerae]|uniref:TlpA family protein disulfide reductase n=1 Tax=Paludisphaera rhizosphaerae TaxID=2711216 RepID=UPI001F0E9ACA|nr:TlpA disulfide reductase family protein [Paludisphaera rhizosphaerae]